MTLERQFSLGKGKSWGKTQLSSSLSQHPWQLGSACAGPKKGIWMARHSIKYSVVSFSKLERERKVTHSQLYALMWEVV